MSGDEKLRRGGQASFLGQCNDERGCSGHKGR